MTTMPEPADRPPTGDLREHFAGLADSECGEHRTVGARAWCYRDGGWCYPDAPCRGCELPALRVRAEEAERERDTAREALNAAAIVITSLRDQRDVALAAADPFKIDRVKSLTAAMTRLVTTERDAARKRAEEAEARNRQYDTAIADERRGRLAAEAAVRRVRRMAQVWIDIRPQHPTLTNEAHALAYGGEQIIAALDAEQPKETP